jgi:DNA repair photolyase
MPQSIQIKSILNKTKRRDAWFLDDYTINPYSGCSFNCLFCYIRGSKYGEHMEEKLSVKTNALEVLEKQLHLRARKNQYGIIVLSSATDPYLHFEKEQKLTRSILEVILKYKFPVHVITRSDLVTRDFDLLHEIDKTAILPPELQPNLKRGTIVTFSFSTIDNSIAAVFEPGATPPAQRLIALQQTIENNFLCGVSLMPLLPYITDTTEHLEIMFSTFAKIKTHYVMPATITLYGNGISDSKTLVLRAVEKKYSHLLEKYQKFFATGQQMPDYYQRAFYKKMQELSSTYNLRNRIIYL